MTCVNFTMDNCYSNINLSFVHYFCIFKLFCSILKEWEGKKQIRAQAGPLARYIYVIPYVQYLKEWKRGEKNTGQGWPVSPEARIGPGSIFPAHI